MIQTLFNSLFNIRCKCNTPLKLKNVYYYDYFMDAFTSSAQVTNGNHLKY